VMDKPGSAKLRRNWMRELGFAKVFLEEMRILGVKIVDSEDRRRWRLAMEIGDDED
jgi:hypothetical protein